MPEVTLTQVLQAREKRVLTQQAMLHAHRCPLICFTMNIAGPVKTSPLIERGFRAGLEALEEALAQVRIRERCLEIEPTGCQAMLSVEWDAARLKELCTAIEDRSPLGRLFDMDVLDTDGRKLTRATQRGCIVCGAPGRACAAGRLHRVDQLQTATHRILREHFARADSARIASAAVQSLIDEVHTTPKPGLVDRRNSGSHTDMDISTFLASAKALEPYFQECVQIGQDTATLPPEQTFPPLRRAGLRAEQDMYRATGGVNTHKGAIYTMGILCGSLGRLWTPESPIPKPEDIFVECGKIAKSAAVDDLAGADGSTAGLRLYLTHGLTGIRGEAAAGLPSVRKIGLPAYEDALHKGLNPNDAGAVALLHLIARVKDTNLYRRGGSDGAAYAAGAAGSLLLRDPFPSMEQLAELDDAFIARNLSPGGCADLLAATYFLHGLTLLGD